MSSPKLTPAEKRKATIAARATKEQEENIAFQNQSYVSGGRQAKQDAKKRAVWNSDKPSTRKRTSSTAPESVGPAKKAREAAASSESGPAAASLEVEEDEVESAPAKSNGKSRKYAAPPIAIDTDESEPEATGKTVRHIDFNNLPAKTKPNAVVGAANAAKGVGGKSAPKAAVSKPAAPKIVADTMSEDEAASSSDDAVDDSCEDSDEDDDLEVVSAAEFTSELPQVISARSTRSRTSSEAAEDSESHELDDVAPRATKPVKKTSHPKFKKDVPQALFDSDSDEYEFVRVRKAVSKSKAPVCKPDSASEDSMPEAPPVRRRRDSDIEMAEFIQKGLVDIPQTHRRLADDTVGLDAAIAASMASEEPRSRRSSTASGYSSGRDLSVPASASEMESDPGSEHEAELHPKKYVQKSKKSKKTSAARQRQADSEKPEIQAPAAQAAASKAPVGASNRPESSWDISARLVLPAPNKAISLTAQHPELQSVLRSGVLQIKLFLLFTNAYPMMISRAGFARPYLIAAAQLRPTSAKILERLLTDPQFGAILAPILLDRVNILRGNMKRCAVSCIFAFFGLAGLDPSKVKERVEELLKDHRYIFPVDPRTGQLQLNKPFRHGAIKFILKEEVFTSSSFVTQNLDRFPATNQKKPDQRELADAMVALVATAVYAALLELRMTGQRQNIAFTEDAYEDTYRNHMDSLKQVREKSPIPFHKLMHEFFNDVTASNQTAHTSSGSSATLIQLGDVPDSD